MPNLSQPQPWLPEYSRLAGIEWLDKDHVRINNIRNFRYRSEEDPLPDWYDQTFRISDVNGVNLVLSCWSSPAIAHVFLSFGFCSNDWLAVSIETRRRENQTWTAFGGFLRNYPVIYVVADERDLIGVRTDIRKERVWLYPLILTQDQCQKLLRDYLMRIEKVNAHPEWYNTLLNNCTTNILRHGQAVSPRVQYNWRILLSGYADQYCYRLGLLDTRLPFPELKQQSLLLRNTSDRITSDFSARIRQQQY
ncbi:DUF4105 domain-containing protein [Photobacterium sp. 2_MG-2023]|uniref:Lnb N-terminal periplasmic domain-containing protein n=1 Tax=Photobacterium sp. 2_MG-2023 TaxID=3062663 RepID=UPI0026E33314|nr:DUF4105 domain-containing protein [Photobacterium sp. 2_MG-2023]MDO6582958.1 DUF4105 domain-containing protein [Photobacterium sp. 2_MG-2023]